MSSWHGCRAGRRSWAQMLCFLAAAIPQSSPTFLRYGLTSVLEWCTRRARALALCGAAMARPPFCCRCFAVERRAVLYYKAFSFSLPPSLLSFFRFYLWNLGACGAGGNSRTRSAVPAGGSPRVAYDGNLVRWARLSRRWVATLRAFANDMTMIDDGAAHSLLLRAATACCWARVTAGVPAVGHRGRVLDWHAWRGACGDLPAPRRCACWNTIRQQALRQEDSRIARARGSAALLSTARALYHACSLPSRLKR